MPQPHGTIGDRTLQLGRALQASGVNVSLSELIDAARAASQIDLGQRQQLHTALRSTLVKDSRHYATFDLAFERYFPLRLAIDRNPDVAVRGLDAAGVADALASGDDLAALAADLVDEHAGIDAAARTERHHVHRVFLGADIARLM